MTKVFESELRGKTVMSNEGGYLGILRGISTNVQTGDLVSIHVEAGQDVNTKGLDKDGQGRLTFPFTAIRAVRDVIVVSMN